MEITIISSDNIPHKEIWAKVLRRKAREFQLSANGNKRDAIMIVLKKGEGSPKAIDTAWRKICLNERKVTPHAKIRQHVLGVTVYLWFDKDGA